MSDQSTAPVSFRQKILNKEIKRAHAMQVRYEDLHVEPGFNLRAPIECLGGKLRQQAEAAEEGLFRHIMSGGQYPALEVRPRAEGGVWIVDGHRRHRNIGRAIAAGAPLQDKDGFVMIDVVAFEGNDAERTKRVISSSKGRGLLTLETAFGYARLARFKWDCERIAAEEGVSSVWVGKLLTLANANTDVHDLILADLVKPTVAIAAVEKYGEAAGEFLRNRGKTTVSDIKGRPLPRKVVSPLISGVDAFIKCLDPNQRATLVDIKEGRVASETITIPTAALIDLFDAHGAVETVRAKQAEKQRLQAEAAAAAGQAEIPTDQDATP